MAQLTLRHQKIGNDKGRGCSSRLIRSEVNRTAYRTLYCILRRKLRLQIANTAFFDIVS